MKESMDGIPIGVNNWLFCKEVFVPGMFKTLALDLAAGASGEVLVVAGVLDVTLRMKKDDFWVEPKLLIVLLTVLKFKEYLIIQKIIISFEFSKWTKSNAF